MSEHTKAIDQSDFKQSHDAQEESPSNTTDNQNALQTNDSFSNHQIDTQVITTDTLSMVDLSPKFRTINLLISAFWGLVIALGIGIVASDIFFELPEHGFTIAMWALAINGVLTLWSLIHHWFADPLKKYALREHDLNFQSGLIFRRLVSQPLLRIQHIEIKRGPIERKAGLATLQVFSAGGVSHTFYIPGLEHERAVELRQFILDHKDLASDV